jgi:glutamate N-acetyltransferase/amino-acid N-acetyltransferase
MAATVSLLRPATPTLLFAAVFTKNAFPGAPVVLGPSRLGQPALKLILISNTIANVCANSGGVADAERVCDALAQQRCLCDDAYVLPCSSDGASPSTR